jgi:hypothetical protein
LNQGDTEPNREQKALDKDVQDRQDDIGREPGVPSLTKEIILSILYILVR